MTPWTEERTNRFADLLADGHSLKDIARIMGVSKNTCIGKLWRMRQQMGEQAK